MRNKETKNEEAKKAAENRNSRLIYGNWRHARGTWSPEAQDAFKNRPKAKVSPLTGREAKMVETVSRLYSESNPTRLVRMTENLIQDLFSFIILPFPIGDSLMRNEQACELFGKTIASLLEDFGNYSLVYSEEKLDQKLLKDSRLIAEKTYFINLRVGMSVKDFLLWYKGTEYVSPRVISEWTAIPMDKLNMVYRQLLNYFRRKLEEANHYASKYSLPAFNIHLEGFNLAINNYSHMEVKVNQ